MKYYQLIYKNGHKQVVSANSDIELIRKYDLATKEHISTKIIQLGNDSLDAVVRQLEYSQQGGEV